MTSALEAAWEKAQALNSTRVHGSEPSAGWSKRASTAVTVMTASQLPSTFDEAEAALEAMGLVDAALFLRECTAAERDPSAYRLKHGAGSLQQYRYPLY